MSAVLITGSAGAGKSAVATVLERRDLACIDDDEDPFLSRFVDLTGAVVAEEPDQPDSAWLSRHRWEWNPARLDELIRAAEPRTLYVCGGADNQLELADRFRSSQDHSAESSGAETSRRDSGWKAAATTIGVQSLHVHDLRHTGNTLAAQDGTSLADLKARMGHDSARAALIYQHATAAADRKIADALGQAIESADADQERADDAS
jgi:hypothetical protein